MSRPLDPRLTEWGYSSLEEAITHLGELLENQTAFDGLSGLSQAEADLAGARGWKEGDELWFDMFGADIRATYMGDCEGWPLVTFDADEGREAPQPVRPSRIRPRSEPKRPSPDPIVRMIETPPSNLDRKGT